MSRAARLHSLMHRLIADRRTWRQRRRRIIHGAIALTVAFSILFQQTGAYAAAHRSIYEPARVSLRPGPIAVALDGLRRAATSAGRALSGLLPGWFPPGDSMVFLPAGRPYPWQPADSGGVPFSVINTANGNLFTEVPIVAWGGLGGGVQFSMYHNNLDPSPMATLPTGWTHSYSRRLSFEEPCSSGTMAMGGGGPEAAGTGSGGSAGAAAAGGPGAWSVWLRTDDGGRLNFVRIGTTSNYTSPPGIRLKLQYVASQYVLSDVHQKKNVFDSAGWLENVQDASGNLIDMEYHTTPTKRLGKVVDIAGNQLELTYDSTTGKLASVYAPPVDPDDDPLPNGRVFAVEYYTSGGSNGKLKRISKADRETGAPYNPLYWCEFEYVSGANRFSWIKDYNGNQTSLSYSSERVNVVTHPSVFNYVTGGPVVTTRTFTYTVPSPDPVLNPCGVLQATQCTVTDERNGLTRYNFDPSGRVSSVVDQLNRTVATIAWTAQNQPDSTTGVLPGSTTTFQYDAALNLTQVTDPNSHSTVMGYDSLNNVTSLRDALLNTTTYQYTDPANPTRVTAINGPGTGGTGAKGIKLTYGQTPAKDLGQLTTLYSPNGTTQTAKYKNGHLTHANFGFGNPYGGSFVELQDAFFVRSPTGEPLVTAPCSYTGQDGGDAIRPVCTNPTLPPDITLPQPQPTIPQGNLECGYDGCEYDPNESGLPLNVCNPCTGPGQHEGSRFSFANTYDPNGNVLHVRDIQPGGHTDVTFAYDALNRPTSETHVANARQIMYTYETSIEGGAVSPNHTLTRFYSDTTGRYKVRYFRSANDTGDKLLEFETEYFTDAAGRVTEIKRGPVGSLVTIATYGYNDSTTLPAVIETKRGGDATSDVRTEYFLDAAGQIWKVLHIRDGAEILDFNYTRDANNRITQIDEYQDGFHKAIIKYYYGHGLLTAADLDPSGTPDPSKLYWNWLPATAMPTSGDPYRLVKEERYGPAAGAADPWAYRKEYWYDPGGNRLSMRESTYDHGTQSWTIDTITRYNYRYNTDYNFADPPYLVHTGSVTGEPNTSSPTIVPTDYAFTDANRQAQGRDQLSSYKVYKPSDPSKITFAVYNYRNFLGYLSQRVEVTSKPGWVKKTTDFRHHAGPMPGRRWLRGARVQEWRDAGAVDLINFAFTETYGYDYQGRRIAKEHCASASPWQNYDPFMTGQSCGKLGGTTYDYDGGNALVERRIDSTATPSEPADRIYSVYAWGPLGLLQRTAAGGDQKHGQGGSCNNDCTYYYLNDATGSCAAVSKRTTAGGAVEPIQITRLDAFGNLLVYRGGPPEIEPLPTADLNCATPPGSCPDELPAEVIAGPPQYHGSQGYEADVIDPKRDQALPPMGRSTGFMHVGVRYYEPATGRFLQYDPLPADPSVVMFGQANRWAYCANDPVSNSDPSGLAVSMLDFVLGVGLIVFAAGLHYYSHQASSAAEGIAMNALAILIGAIGAALIISNYLALFQNVAKLVEMLAPIVVQALMFLLRGFLLMLGALLGINNPCFVAAVRNAKTIQDLVIILIDLITGQFGFALPQEIRRRKPLGPWDEPTRRTQFAMGGDRRGAMNTAHPGAPHGQNQGAG